MNDFKEGDRVVIKGTTEPKYTVRGKQHGVWVGLRVDGSRRVRTIDGSGYDNSDVDVAFRAGDLELAQS